MIVKTRLDGKSIYLRGRGVSWNDLTKTKVGDMGVKRNARPLIYLKKAVGPFTVRV
jgi:hypothetical protein